MIERNCCNCSATAECLPVFGSLSDLSLHLLHGSLVNHSFVDHSQVGFGYSNNNVQCHYHGTSRCCNGSEDEYRGYWYFPNGTRVPVDGDIFESHGGHRVDIHNGLISGVLPSGIYRCEFLSNDSVSEAIYVGLYDNYEGTLY